jgi:hypothetical protein
MEGLVFYYVILFVLSVINIYLLILCILTALKVNVRTLYLLLGSLVLAIFVFPRTLGEFFPFDSIENAVITLTILGLVNAGIRFIYTRKFR